MAWLEERAAGWVNLQPEVRGVPPLRHSALVSLFERRPPELTLATWAPGRHRSQRTEPPTIGIQHGRPDTVRSLLGQAGLALPAGWRLVQDRPRAGLVARLPAGAPHDEVLAWLIEAVQAVSSFPVTGTWRALIRQPR
jgi:hypothetical protein